METSFFRDVKDIINYLFQPGHLCDFFEGITKNPLFYWLIAVVLFYFAYRIYHRDYSKILRVHTTKRGFVYIKRSALKNLIKKVCRSVVAQSNARVKIYVRCKKLYIKVAISSPYDVQPTGTQLQQSLYQVLQQEVGLSNVGRIDVVINHIFGAAQTNRPECNKNDCCKNSCDCYKTSEFDKDCCTSEE